MVPPLYEGVQGPAHWVFHSAGSQYPGRTDIQTRQTDKQTNMKVVVGLVNLASWNLPRLEHPGLSLSLYDEQVVGAQVLPRCATQYE